jgi:quercetin dioxygenase-like cupin family protein
MHAPFLITPPTTDDAIDNGITQLSMLLEPGRAPGFAVFVNDFPAHGDGPPAHHHNSYDEAFYILAGEIEFCVDGTTARATAGSMAFIPRGATHAFRNTCAEPARMLVITTPEAVDLILRMPEGANDPEVLRALWAQHDSQIDGPPLGATA